MIASRTGSNVEIPYDSAGSAIQVYPDATDLTWDAFFQTTAGCPIVSCSTYTSGSCGTTAFSSTNVAFDSVTYAVTASETVIAGYVDLMCIRCHNDYTHADMDSWQISLMNKCVTSLTSIPTTTASSTVSLATISELQIEIVKPTSDANWEQVFLNTEPADCPLTTCGIYNYNSCGVGTLT